MYQNHLTTKRSVTGMKQWTRKTFVFLLMLVLVLGSAMGAYADGKGKGKDKDDDYDFKDANLAPWAIEYMTSMQLKGVMEGYEDGTFQPNKPIRQIEAIITAVRLLGLETEAQAKMNVKLNFEDNELIEKKFPWAVGYIAVALEQGLFESDDNKVQPEKPASRVWTATLLVKALGKDAEAKAKMNTALAFKDASSIPAGSVGYVAVAVENKLVEGYNDNTFRANKPVTRAEMAALLDRLDGQIDNALDQNEVRGTLVSSSATSITLQTTNNASMTLTLADTYYVFLNRKAATLADLRTGDAVTVRTVDGKAVLISVKVEKVEVEGTVLSVTPTTVTGQVYTTANLIVQTQDNVNVPLSLNTDTKVTYKGKEVGVSAIQVGDEVEAKIERNQVKEVKIEDREELELENVTLKQFTLDASQRLTTITVVGANNAEHTFAVAADAKIDLDGAATLVVGDELELKLDGNVVTKIKVKND
jgi:anaerobic selenocysteine-containing dehydrogenase